MNKSTKVNDPSMASLQRNPASGGSGLELVMGACAPFQSDESAPNPNTYTHYTLEAGTGPRNMPETPTKAEQMMNQGGF